MAQAMPWGDLQYFRAVCEGGSIAAAARAMGVNHSTVLRRINSLEQSLQVQLFDRLPSGYSLTERGQHLANGMAAVSEQFDSLERQITGADLALRGSLRLTAPDSLVQSLLLPSLAAFSQRHPKVQLEVLIHDRYFSLSRREADVALRGANEPPENLIGRPVGIMQTALFAAKSYLERQPNQLPLEQQSWVVPSEALAHLASAQWLRRKVPAERWVLQVDSLVALADAVAAGVGIGWLLLPLAAQRPGLVQLQPPNEAFNTKLWVLTHPDLRRMARVRALSDCLYQALSTDPRLLHA